MKLLSGTGQQSFVKKEADSCLRKSRNNRQSNEKQMLHEKRHSIAKYTSSQQQVDVAAIQKHAPAYFSRF